MTKVWFITGTSRGFGREWTIAALDRGDQVVATARNAGTLGDLAAQYGESILPLQLDVTDKVAVGRAVAAAVERFGRIDIAVNSAGYGHFGLVEELSEDEFRDQMETNLFGAVWVTQAVLPAMREQGSGHIIQVSSIGGVSAFPNLGAYNASKWALEGMSQSLAQEVADFGIRVTLIEPGAFATDWGGSSARHSDESSVYDEYRLKMQEQRKARTAAPGDPTATRGAILELIDTAEPPLRVFFGTAPLAIVENDYNSRLALWRQWQPLAERAQG